MIRKVLDFLEPEPVSEAFKRTNQIISVAIVTTLLLILLNLVIVELYLTFADAVTPISQATRALIVSLFASLLMATKSQGEGFTSALWRTIFKSVERREEVSAGLTWVATLGWIFSAIFGLVLLMLILILRYPSEDADPVAFVRGLTPLLALAAIGVWLKMMGFSYVIPHWLRRLFNTLFEAPKRIQIIKSKWRTSRHTFGTELIFAYLWENLRLIIIGMLLIVCLPVLILLMLWIESGAKPSGDN
jgi:hypothetical protein